jgi:hypothetical protein
VDAYDNTDLLVANIDLILEQVLDGEALSDKNLLIGDVSDGRTHLIN